MAQITQEQVVAAFSALATLQRDRALEYWSPNLHWLVPGRNRVSGWKENLDDFLDAMSTVIRLSENNFHADPITVITGDDTAAYVVHVHDHRVDEPQRIVDFDTIYFTRWRDGKIIEGSASISGDGTAQYDAFLA